MITLTQIWESSTGLLKRFDLLPSRKAAYLKFAEETQEFSDATSELAENPKHHLLREDAAAECADILVTTLNMAYSAGLTIEEIEKAMKAVIEKNDLKSDITHHVVNGFIARKPVALEAQS